VRAHDCPPGAAPADSVPPSPFPPSAQLEGELVKPPRPLAWYPDQLAWQMDFSRGQLRKVGAGWRAGRAGVGWGGGWGVGGGIPKCGGRQRCGVVRWGTVADPVGPRACTVLMVAARTPFPPPPHPQLPWLGKIHEFMKTATEDGAISRQEAVSMVPPLFMDVAPHHRVRGWWRGREVGVAAAGGMQGERCVRLA
jgi:hypothetical protein